MNKYRLKLTENISQMVILIEKNSNCSFQIPELLSFIDLQQHLIIYLILQKNMFISLRTGFLLFSTFQ